MRPAARRWITAHGPALMWVYLALITAAELLTAAVQPQAGLLLHALLLVSLILHAALGRPAAVRRLALALSLAPMIRLLSLSLPLPDFPQLAWYPIVSVPLLVAIAILIRQTRLSRHALGLRSGTLSLQLLLTSGGLGLGAIEYAILQPPLLIDSLSWQRLWLPALSLVVFTGFTEELLFRGVLQALALPVLGRWGLIYVAALFAVLHIGYLSVVDVVFVFAVGLLFAWLVVWDQSLLGVTLAHGLTNVTMFLIMPLLAQSGLAWAQHLLIWGSSLVAVVAIVLLAWRARPAAGRSASAQADGTTAVTEPAPLWRDSPDSIRPGEYEQLYQQLTADLEPPLLHIHVTASRPVALRALIFVPRTLVYDQDGQAVCGRLDLYVRGRPVIADVSALLPAHYRFVSGVVELDALPGPISAQAVRDNTALYHVSRLLSQRLTSELSALADRQPTLFGAFWPVLAPALRSDPDMAMRASAAPHPPRRR